MSTMRLKNKDGTWDKVPVLGSYQAVLAANEAATNAQNAATHAEVQADSVKKYKALWFDSVAAMKAEPSLTAGAYVCTAGYYEPNDGGSANYIIRAKTDSDIDDGGSLHQLSNGLVAELIVENGTVYPEQFGAVGDGKADDTNALQGAIDHAFNNKLIVRLLAKTYKISSPLVIHGSTSSVRWGSVIIGAARTESKIVTDNEIECLLQIGDVGSTDVSSINVYNLHLNGNKKARKGISFTFSTSGCNFENLKIADCTQYGVYVSNDLYLSKFVFVRVDYCTEGGFYFEETGIITSINLINCYVQSSAIAYKINGIYMQMTNCCADVISDTVLYLDHYHGAITSFGSEASMAKKMFRGGNGTNVTIVGAFTYGNFDDADAIHVYAISDARMVFIGGDILFDRQEQGRTAPGRLFYVVSTTSIHFIRTNCGKYATKTSLSLASSFSFDNNWKTYVMKQSTAAFDLTDLDYEELQVEVTDGTVRFALRLLKMELGDTYNTYSTGFNGSNNNYCQINAKKDSVNLSKLIIGGSDVTDSAYIKLWVK